MKLIKKGYGRYATVDEYGNERLLTNKELIEIRKLTMKCVNRSAKVKIIKAKLGRIRKMENTVAVPMKHMIILDSNKIQKLLEEDNSEGRKKMQERYNRACKRIVQR